MDLAQILFLAFWAKGGQFFIGTCGGSFFTGTFFGSFSIGTFFGSCMQYDTGCIPDDTGCIPDDTGCIPDDTGYIRDTSGTQPKHNNVQVHGYVKKSSKSGRGLVLTKLANQ